MFIHVRYSIICSYRHSKEKVWSDVLYISHKKIFTCKTIIILILYFSEFQSCIIDCSCTRNSVLTLCMFNSLPHYIYIHEFSKDFQYLMVYLNLCLSRTTSQFTWHSNGHQYISFVYPIVCLQESDYWMYNVLCSKIKYIFQHLNCFGVFSHLEL